MAGLPCGDMHATEQHDVLSVLIFIKHLSSDFQTYVACANRYVDRSKK